MRSFLGLCALAMLTGCPKTTESDTGTPDTDTTGVAADVDITVADITTNDWGTTTFTLTVGGNTADLAYLGIAETNVGSPDGWFGEDCLDGDMTNDSNICHQAATSSFALSYKTTIAEVEASPDTSTLFNANLALNGSGDDLLTYVLDITDQQGTPADPGDDVSKCYVWGDDTDFFKVDHADIFGTCTPL
jgi:hypothetical protein